MIGLPPSLLGAAKAMLTCALPRVAVPMPGAPGSVAGVTLFDAAEAALLPSAFVAITLQAIGVPLLSPVTVIGEAAPVALCAPQLAV